MVMGSEVLKVDYSKEQALVETVRASIFPKSTDEQLMLYFHKCQTMGVHPLDGMIHPSVYKGNAGEPDKVVFVTSIDVLRSRSTESGLDDGIDEPEYGPEMDFECEKETIQVPEWVKVRVYKKGVARPYTGVARWKEYYPGEKRGHQYRQKPYLMLAKCAEALARRLAFPKELDKLYTPEEMEATTAMLAGIPDKSSTKPKVTPDQVTEVKQPARTQVAPGNVAIVESVDVKTGTGKKGSWSRYGVKIGGKVYGTFDTKLGDAAKSMIGKQVEFTSENDGKYDNLTGISLFTAAAPAAAQEEGVMDAEAFAVLVNQLSLAAGIPDIDGILEAEFSVQGGPVNVPAAMQAQILDFLQGNQQQPGA
jgi:phage recombination protein Bet